MTHTITELITELEALRAEHGDLLVYVSDEDQVRAPTPSLEGSDDGKRVNL